MIVAKCLLDFIGGETPCRFWSLTSYRSVTHLHNMMHLITWQSDDT